MVARIAFLLSMTMLGFADDARAQGKIERIDQPEAPLQVKEVKKGEGKADKKNENRDLIVHGHIVKADPIDKGRNVPGKVHAVRMIKGKGYIIDMVSVDFDSYLRLEDSGGTELAQDDDGGGYPNARIRFTALKDDTYLIFATTLGGGEGNYTLTVRTVGAAAPVKVVKMAAPTAQKASEHDGQLAATDPADQIRKTAARSHTVELKKGKTYVIDLMSQQFDCYLLLYDANAKLLAQDDDGGGNLNSRIEFTPDADGTFRLAATTFNGRFGEYSLRVTEK